MTTCAQEYRKQLKKSLRCTAAVKNRLMNTFESSFSSYLEENPVPLKEDLLAAFGPPEEMAAVLMTEVSEEEKEEYRRRITLQRIFIWVLIPIVILVSWLGMVTIATLDLWEDNYGYIQETDKPIDSELIGT